VGSVGGEVARGHLAIGQATYPPHDKRIIVLIGVRMFGTGWDKMGLQEQNRVFMIGTKVLFHT